LLKELKISVIGVIENMKMNNSKAVRQQTRKLGVKFLGEIPYEQKLEEAIGNTTKLLDTRFAKKISNIQDLLGVTSEK
jgi:MinD superfamily P-loop ATPase